VAGPRPDDVTSREGVADSGGRGLEAAAMQLLCGRAVDVHDFGSGERNNLEERKLSFENLFIVL
jgi:hypothetical protein